MIPDQDIEFLKEKFAEEMLNPVTIIAFTKKTQGPDAAEVECEFCNETQQIVEEIAELSDKIKVERHEFSPEDSMVKNLGVDKLPALVIQGPKQGAVKYYGIPGGFEFSSLVEDIVDASRGSTDLSDCVKEKIRGIHRDAHIQVFMTPTCPYCPSAVRIAHQMAMENPDHIKADAVEASEFPHLVSKYELAAVPTVIINEKVQFEGALPDDEFADQVVEALAA
jgi:glutaredoxin-like protein